MEKQEIIDKLKEKLNKEQEEIGMQVPFEEIDDSFYIKDHIVEKGHVSESAIKQMCSIVTETFQAWVGYLHSIIMPNPQNLLNVGESKVFDNEEKKEITNLMKTAMEISSRNSLIGLKKDKKLQVEFLKDCLKIWNEKFCPSMIKIMEKVNKEWKEEVLEKK
ncbi:MAG: hypothetical protein ACOCUU_00795 [Nanoarchaeota archaeon]